MQFDCELYGPAFLKKDNLQLQYLQLHNLAISANVM